MLSQFYCFVLVLLIAFDLSSSSTLTSNNFAKHHVRIINNLNNKLLNYHCKSGDNDLGIRTLQPKGEWEFSFRLHWIASTLFYCYFWYDNFYAAFDVYSAYLAKVWWEQLLLDSTRGWILLILSKVGSEYKDA